ncbi:MAG: thioester reductase domain-containing protein [Bryobacteraceae bacterium]|nr:thioester reductase domain-containing protein [Bryobacteraceae bacterium]
MIDILRDLDGWTSRNPDKRLYTFLDLGGRETQAYTYAEFAARTYGIAKHLREAGFQKGDRLMLAYPAGLEVIAAFYGCIRAGLIPVPAYPPTSHGLHASLLRMAHIARDCDASGVLTGEEYHGSLRANLAKQGVRESLNGTGFVTELPWIATDGFAASSEPFHTDPNEALFLQYTSGSTSNPKGVVVTHDNILHNCWLVGDYPDPTAVSWLPQYHDMGLIGYYIYPALRGGSTYGFSPMDFIQRPALWLESLTKYRARASSAPNFAFEYCLRPGRIPQETLDRIDLSALDFLMTAAEPVRPDTYRNFLAKFEPHGLKPESFFVAYGLAEATLAVSSFGRNVITVNKRALALGRAKAIHSASEIVASKQLMSCGKPLGDIEVRIVEPDKHVALEDGAVGEIWVRGRSNAAGYWNQPELSKRTFAARVIRGSHGEDGYMRTGDLGFLHEGELYACGRIKDMIIVRGQNYYPQDVETIVEESSEAIRKTCVAAFEINEDSSPGLAVVAEVKSVREVPDPLEIVAAIRKYLNVEAACVALIAPRAIPKTSSGKISRHQAKQMWLEGKFHVLKRTSEETPAHGASAESVSPFDDIKSRYNLTGNEKHTLVEAGVDSVDLVVFMHEIKELLKEKGAELLASQVDVRLIQRITVADLFRLAEMFEKSPESAVIQVRRALHGMQEEMRAAEERAMRADRKLAFRPKGSQPPPAADGAILLTGGTGFLGPFLLKSLIEQTRKPIYVLVRAADPAQAMRRLRDGLATIDDAQSMLAHRFDERVIPVCGDLAQPNLGLDATTWKRLSEETSDIFHNGATVNYLYSYENMRAANVGGTNEAVRLAMEGSRKIFNLVSTTFIFGWATKEVLYETDHNRNMELLDFGYSQSKWVAEQVVLDAMANHGLTGRVFRPALISPSVHGGGDNLDIAMRTLAFMIKHGIGVDALNQVSFVPADVCAANIAAISGDPSTVGGSFHVVRDDYNNMVDVTDIIGRLTGRKFEMHKIKAFVPEVIRRCTREDLLFPLLDFLIGSVDSIASMEFKRYDSSEYQKARDRSPHGRPDPSLEETVAGILRFMHRRGILSVPSSVFEAARPDSAAQTQPV